MAVSSLDNEIVARLEAHVPRSLLVVGPQDAADVTVVGELRRRHPDMAVTALPHDQAPGALERMGRFEAALVVGALEHMDGEAGARLLAALRDLHAARLYAVVPGRDAAGRWTDEALRGLGLTRAAGGDDGPSLYVFDIAEYKQTPDWLNPDHWANPELWDKHRW